jgi:hypothetical protein
VRTFLCAISETEVEVIHELPLPQPLQWQDDRLNVSESFGFIAALGIQTAMIIVPTVSI